MLLWAVAFAAGAAAYNADRGAPGGNTGQVLIPILTALILISISGFLLLRGSANKKRFAIFCVIWLMMPVFAILGFFRMHESDQPGELKQYLTRATAAAVTGIIEYISVKDDGYTLTITDSEVRIGSDILYPEKILISNKADNELEPFVGAFIHASGKIYPFEKATNPGQFDSEMYYAIRHAEGRLNAKEISIVPYTLGFYKKLKYGIGQGLFRFRMWLTKNIFRILPYTEASVLNSMLTGDRGLLEAEIKELYSEGGIAHILSISSLHITLLGMGLFRLLLKLTGRLKISVVSTIMTMFGFLVLTGDSVSTRRAVIMITIMLTGRMIGRSYDMLNGAGMAALIILMMEPLNIYDSGFRLSFMAVAGIYAASVVVRVWEIKHMMVRSLIMSASVQLITLPVLLNTYYGFNPYSVIVNIMILPLMSILLIAGFGAAATGLKFPAGPVYYILRLYNVICEGESMLPHAKVITGAPMPFMMIIYYACVILFLNLLMHRPYVLKKVKSRENGILERETIKQNGLATGRKAQKTSKRRNYLLTAILTGCVVIGLKWPSGSFFTAFLDVGQGDCIYFEAEGMSFLSDAGSSNVRNVGKYRVIPYLKHRGVRYLDKVFISHTDSDHISAVLEIIEEGYPVIGEIVFGDNIDKSKEIVAKAEMKGIPVRYVSSGEEFTSEKENGLLNIRVIAPDFGVRYEDANSGSLVAEVSFGDFKMLLTGDSGFESEEKYTGKVSQGSFSILKCAHHGSKYSTSEKMLSIIDPLLTVISCSKYNTYGHPSPAAMERLRNAGSAIITTPESGAVLVSVEKDRMSVEEYGK